MSLYNMLFGVNPAGGLVMQALGITPDDVPRFRDAYFDAEKDRLVIHTRTGGGNRDYYECEERCRDNYPEYFGEEQELSGPWNADIRKLPGFLYDEDDDFDSTYADWFFSVPEAFKPIFATLKEIGASQDEKLAERWQRVLEDLRSGEKSPEADRALVVGEQIMAELTAKLA